MQGGSPQDGTAVAGLFYSGTDAEHAIYALHDAGFQDEDIGVAVRDRGPQQVLTEETGAKTVQAGTAGAVGGGILGGVLGLLAGLGVMAIPGVGPVIAGGVLGSTLAGAGIGAAAGGLAGALIGMGIPEDEARHFERGFERGAILLTVYAGVRAAEARRVLAGAGADLGPGHERRIAESNLMEGELRIPVMEEPASATDPLSGNVEAPLAGRVNVEAEGGDVSSTWRGDERRFGDDPNYAGPERRRAHIR